MRAKSCCSPRERDLNKKTLSSLANPIKSVKLEVARLINRAFMRLIFLSIMTPLVILVAPPAWAQNTNPLPVLDRAQPRVNPFERANSSSPKVPPGLDPTQDSQRSKEGSVGLEDVIKRHVLMDQTIRQGDLLNTALEVLAKAEGWTFIWYPIVSWRAVADIDLRAYADALSAVMELVRIMRQEGKPIQLRVSKVNRVMEVLSTEVLHE
jgi:Toxin co-regulated pilus biosynthesis protein Q